MTACFLTDIPLGALSSRPCRAGFGGHVLATGLYFDKRTIAQSHPVDHAVSQGHTSSEDIDSNKGRYHHLVID